MHYEVYIDKLWLTDFMINTYLLLLVRRTFGLRSRLVKLFLSAAVNAAIFVFLLLLPAIHIWIKLLLQILPVNLLLLQAAFSFRTKEMVVKSYVCMNGYGLLLGGMLFFLSAYLPEGEDSINLFTILLGTGMTTLSVLIYLHYRRSKEERRGIYRVMLDFYGETFFCKGFADSGNGLYEPYGKRPVSVLQKQAVEGFLYRVPPEKHYLIPYHSIGKSHGLLSAVELPLMEVDSGERKAVFHRVVVALAEERLSEREDYQLILHPEFVEQEA